MLEIHLGRRRVSRVAVAAAVLCGVITAARAGWVDHSPGGATPYHSVFFIDSSTGWVAGASGTVLTTTDGGVGWTPQTSGIVGDLYSVFFVDASNGWMVGDNGAILATTDGGGSWNPQVSGTTRDLRSVHFANATTGWAVGHGGTVRTTTDGGATWSSQTSNTTNALESVCFVDASTGWIVGDGGTILETTDGGTSWNPQGSGTGNTLSSIDCLDASTAWVAGDGGTLLKTTDGGTTWTPKSTGTGATLNGVEFTGAGTGWAVGALGLILKSSDGGETWFDESSGSSSTLEDVYFASPTTGWAVGAPATVLATITGGDVIDLSLSKVVDNPSPYVGFNVVFTITVSNAASADPATGVEVADPLPSGYQYVSDSGSGAYDSGSGIWSVGSLDPGDSVGLTITGEVLMAGDWTNVTEVTAADQPDSDSTPGDGSGDDYDTAATVPAGLAPLVVNSTGDAPDASPGDGTCLTAGGVCTLRAAIEESNARAGDDTIVFDIPLADPGYDGTAWLLLPATNLPALSDPAVIDATTQPGYGGTPVIDLDGSDISGTRLGLRLFAGSSTIRGFAIHDFRDGIVIGSSNNTVQACYSGLDYTGSSAGKGNSKIGILIDDAAGNTIGGTDAADRNVVSDNGDNGIWIDGANAIGNVVQGNYVGTDATGVLDRGNLRDGVIMSTAASDNLVGGGVAGAGNRIAFNGQAGVVVSQNAIGNTLERSVIYSNTDLGIDLQGSVGVDSNDAGDVDSGANNLQNYPVLAGAFHAGGGTTIAGTLNSEPGATYKLDFYADSVADPSGHGEGETYLGSSTVDTDGNGDGSFVVGVATVVPLGNLVTATATHPDKSTSEFSANSVVVAEMVDLSLVKAVDNPEPLVGDNVVFTVTVSNAPLFTDATGVQVRDLLPSGFTFVGDDGGGAYDPGTGLWTIGNLAAGSSATLHITAQVLGGGARTNVAEVTAADQSDIDSTPDDGAGDDYDSTAASPLIDLSLTKTVDDATPTVGDNVVFTIVVSNAAGVADATGVQVTDALPAGYAYVGDDGGGAYVAGTGVWTVGTLIAGGSSTLNVTATVLGAGDHTNVAEVTAADQIDVDSTPNDGAGDDYDTASTVPSYEVSGTVYHDINANGVLDAGELGVGTVWVKLQSAGIVEQVVQADLESGAYTVTSLSNGSYTLIVDDNDDVNDVTATAPTDWLFQNPATGTLNVDVSDASVGGNDFGLVYDFDLGTDCACGYDDGLLTQTSINVDGDMADWGPVLTDGDNNACDATDDTDRDHPVQSTGRNLLRVAVTYDAMYFSMWTQRVGSSNNTQNFLYYADTNVDGIMVAGEPVVVAKWQGNTGTVVLELYSYDDLGSGGDPMLDVDGYADGWSLPGDLTFVKTLPAGTGQGSTSGASDGTEMEWTILWAELGVAPGAAIGWHVSSTNATPGSAGLGAQIDDNIGGCGGQCTGSNQFGGVLGTPIGSTPGQTVHAFHQFTNTGNGNDLFDLTWTSTGDFAPVSVTFYSDLGTAGQYDPGVDTVLTDTDGDTTPDTGLLTAGQTFDLIVAIELPGPPASGTATVTTTATSNFVPGCGGTVTPASDSVDDEIELGPLQLVKRAFQSDGTPIADGSAVPSGIPVKFLVYLDNPGGLAVADLAIQDVLDPLYQYVTGSLRADNSLLSSVVCPGGSCDEAAIFSQVDAAGTALGEGDAVTAPVDTDEASYDGATRTIDVGDSNNPNNAPLNVAADSVWALLFTVTLQ